MGAKMGSWLGSLVGAGIALVLSLAATEATVADELKGIGACPQGPNGVCFGIPPAPAGGIIREIAYNAPGPGQTLVLVSGSGWCQNAYTEAEEVADFATQIVNTGNATVNHRGPGGLRFLNRLPKALPPPQGSNVVQPKIVPINFSSSRVFAVTSAKRVKYFLKLNAIQLDAHVACYGYALNMTVLFVPN